MREKTETLTLVYENRHPPFVISQPLESPVWDDYGVYHFKGPAWVDEIIHEQSRMDGGRKTTVRLSIYPCITLS